MTARALIDGDIVAYRSASACQKDIQWGDDQGPTVDPDEAAQAGIQGVRIWASLVGLRAPPVVTFTGRENWRKRVLETYKHNRKGKSKPLAYVYTVNAISEAFETVCVEGLEADDVMGILLTNPGYAGSVCATIDKDLRTVPGLHLNPTKDTSPCLVTPEQANWLWMRQTLTGDITDGYTGIPGVGPKKAEAILGPIGQDIGSLWDRVLRAYRAAKLTEEDALVQARVSRILQHSDYNKSLKEISLWHPTNPSSLPLRSPPATA